MITTKAKDGRWYVLPDNRFIHGCCTCGVEHDVTAKIKNGRVWLRWFKRKKI